MTGKLSMVQSLLEHGATVNTQNELGDTPLYEACFEGNQATVDTMIKNGANFDLANLNDITCLMIGTYADNADVIEYLVERGVDVNTRDRDGRNVLFYVAAEGQPDTLAYLLDSGTKMCKDTNGVSIMMEAVLHGNTDVVRYLIRYDKVLGLSPDDVDFMGRNVLFYHVHSEDVKLLELLLSWGVMISPANDGRTLLMNAALKCNVSLVKYLIDNAAKLGLNLDERDTKGRNCLFYCITGGDLDLFTFLLNNNVSICNSEDDVTILMQAVAKNRADFTQKIIEHDENFHVDIDAVDRDGWDAAMYACASGHVHLFKMLVVYGAQCHVAFDGRTVLMQAAAKGDVAFVRYLLENGSDFQVFGNQRDSDGWNALFYTVQGGHMETFKFLLSRGTKVCTAHNGATLLMEAVDKNKPKFVVYLLTNAETLGIDIHATDKEGNNALFYAAAGGSVPMMQRLLREGCRVVSDGHQRTLLMQASLHGHVAMVDYLIANHLTICIDLHQQDKDERNALFYCVEGGHLEVIQALLNAGVKTHCDKFARTNLMQAARAGHLHVVQYLLENQSRLDLNINARDRNGENALFYAVRSRNIAIITSLLQSGLKLVNNNNGIGVLAQSLCEGRDDVVQAVLAHTLDLTGAMSGRDSKGRTVLHHYVERGDLEMLNRLSRFYSPEKDSDLTGMTLLMSAAKQPDYMHIVKYLVDDLKVDVDQLDFRSRCAVFYATEACNLPCTNYLLSHIKRLESDKDGLSVLMVAIASSDHSLVDALLQSKQGKELVNRRDKHGRNEVHYSAIHGYTPLLEMLQHYGSDLDVQDSDGQTPIMCACANGRFGILQMLLRKGADIDMPDNKGRNAVHYCFGSNPSLNCAKVLVKFDADLNHRDEDGVSPLMLACQTCAKSMISIISFLVDYGADPIAQDNQGKDAFDYCPFDAEYVKAAMRNSSVMDKNQWATIQKYRPQLIQDVEINSTLRGLIRERIFTRTLHFEVIKKPQSERVDRMLDLLRERGPRAFRTLCQILKENYENELAYCMLKDAYQRNDEVYW